MSHHKIAALIRSPPGRAGPFSLLEESTGADGDRPPAGGKGGTVGQPWTVDEARVTELRRAFSGQVLRPDDHGYEDAPKLHNGLIDKRPGLIARCAGLGDIVDAVQFARANKLEVAVRGGGGLRRRRTAWWAGKKRGGGGGGGGGQRGAGGPPIEDGLMIDLSLMKG